MGPGPSPLQPGLEITGALLQGIGPAFVSKVQGPALVHCLPLGGACYLPRGRGEERRHRPPFNDCFEEEYVILHPWPHSWIEALGRLPTLEQVRPG